MIAFFARHPVAANLMLLAGLVIGALSISSMERETFPEFSTSSVTVSVPYPGATAEDVDEEICLVLEDSLSSVTGLDAFTCLSVAGSARATLDMVETGDLSQFFNDILSEVSAIQNLPDDANEPSVSINAQTETIALLAVTGLISDEGLVFYADQLADDLVRLPGVAQANVRGVSGLQYDIRLDSVALRRYGLAPSDVADAISARSVQRPLGTVALQGEDLNLRLTDARRSASALEDITIVEGADEGVVSLADVARVTLSLADPDKRAVLDGARAAIIALAKAPDDDAIDAFAGLEAELARLETAYGGTIEFTIINNATEVVSDQIALVLRNAAQSLALVILVMCLFFSIRDALWISMALPFSFLTGLFVMSALGVTINVMSLLALLMSIGIIMDDSIVIAENIAKKRRTLPSGEAAIAGAKEVLAGVVSSFLTTAGVFGPLMFLSGEIGAVLQVVPVVLLVTLTASLIEAFLILPHHLSHGTDGETRERFVQRMLTRFSDGAVVPLVTVLTRWRYLTFGCVLGVLILVMGLIFGGQVRVVGFPEVEADTIQARLALQPGTQQDRTQAAVEAIVEGIGKVDADLTPNTNGAQPLVERVLVEYGQNADTNDNGAHTATITVDLLSSDDRNVTAASVLSAWQDAAGPIADVAQINFASTSRGPGGNDLDLSLFSRDTEQLLGASNMLVALLAARSDVTSVYSDFTLGRSEFQVSLNTYGASLGLTPSVLAGQLQTAFSGTETDSFRIGVTNIDVVVKQSDVAPSRADLEAYPITLASGVQVALTQVANISETQALSQITREDGLARASIIGSIDRTVQTAGGISSFALTQLAPQIVAAFPNVEMTAGGASTEQAETQGSILTALSIGLLVVYIVLAFEFRSYTLPIFIMMSIPFALIGVVFGHMAMGMDLSMPSLIGAASLAGIVVNNAILFVTFFETHAQDNDHVSAAVEAMRQRFRAVVLSSTTTFIGLIPVVFETSPSLASIVPVVTSVSFGVIASMFLVILVFPSILAIYFDFASLPKWLATKTDAPKAATEATSAPATP